MKTETMATTEQNKVAYRRYIDEAFNEGRLEELDRLVSPNYVYHDAPPGTPTGVEGLRNVIRQFREAFPDLQISIDDQVAEGDKVCSLSTMRGTHKGLLFGLPPTGKEVVVKGMTMVRVADGRIAESWVKNDTLSLLRQLGVTALPR